MKYVLFRIVDAETTAIKVGVEGVCELGWTDLLFEPESKICHIGQPGSILYRPAHPIPPEAMAIHHITDEDVADCTGCSETDLRALVGSSSTWDDVGPPAFIASHNWSMEAQFFTSEILGNARPICTMKVARRVWPEAPGYGNQVLRYWRKLPVDRVLASPPHRAPADTHVTAHLLAVQLQEARVSHMVHWTQEPQYYATCPLFKYKGRAWPDVPADYLEWMTGPKAKDLDPDLIETAKNEMRRRFAPK